jgi:hypothetical protein
MPVRGCVFAWDSLLSQHCTAGHDKSCPYAVYWKIARYQIPEYVGADAHIGPRAMVLNFAGSLTFPGGKVAPKATDEGYAPIPNVGSVYSHVIANHPKDGVAIRSPGVRIATSLRASQ